MQYWHIQMNQPEGRNGITINSREMLEEAVPIIGTGEWEDHQCYQFKNTIGSGMKIGDIVVVREGETVLALCKVTSDVFQDDELFERYQNANLRKVEVIDWYTGGKPFPQPQGTLQRLVNRQTRSWKFVHNWYRLIIYKGNMNEKIAILQYKKQIILQGPPGTGKTKLAMEMAREWVSPQAITQLDVNRVLSVGLVIHSATERTEYTIRAIDNAGVTVALANLNEYKTSYAEIIAAYATRMWNGGQVNGNDSYAAAIAKYTYEHLALAHCKFIQFHPSYTYEDFVRGIVAQSSGTQIEYKTVNKLLGAFAKEALENYELSRQGDTLRRNYVLIIDEINRANLSSVLGELIYALEYRGRKVESMYAVDGETKLVLPKNLYIIGTMNTADRSVGHIDYAIRRRFAFVEVLPEDLSIELNDTFHKPLFNEVGALFEKYLSPEFEKKDVQLGHSYFIDKTSEGGSMAVRLQYEIKPILREYAKDGILVGKDIAQVIEKLSV